MSSTSLKGEGKEKGKRRRELGLKVSGILTRGEERMSAIIIRCGTVRTAGTVTFVQINYRSRRQVMRGSTAAEGRWIILPAASGNGMTAKTSNTGTI
jgi:hypothetical protein